MKIDSLLLEKYLYRKKLKNLKERFAFYILSEELFWNKRTKA